MIPVSLTFDGDDPALNILHRFVRKHTRKVAYPIAVEIRDGELEGLLGGLAPLAGALRNLGGIIVYDGIEIRESPTVPKGRFMPVYVCRVCDGARCIRCHMTGEQRGKR